MGLVIINYNSGGDLERCLNCVAGQLRQPARVIVVDNQSSDDSLVNARRARISFECVENGTNLGFAAAANQGIAQLRESVDYVALLNPDAFPHPGWLDSLFNAIDRHADCGVAASRMMCASDKERVDGLGDAYHFSGLAWRRYHGHRLEDVDRIDRRPFGACAGAALYRVKAIEAVGGFDESYFCYMEDVDLAFRLRLAGYHCRLAVDAVVDHVGSASTGYRSDFSTYHGHRNLVWTFTKNMPSALFWPLLPLHVFANLLSFLVALPRRQIGVVARAKWDALRQIGRIWRARQIIQSRRKAKTIDIWRALDRSIWSRA